MSQSNKVVQALGALERCLLAQGAKINAGAGVAAAERCYSAVGTS